MSALISGQNGNFSTSTPWQLVDPTSYSNIETGGTANTTSWIANLTPFAPGAITIDGIGIKVSAHTAVGNVGVKLGKSGTFTGVTVASPGVFTTAVAHGLTTGETILLTNTSTTPVTTALAWAVTVLSPTTFSLVQSNGSALNITASATTWSSATTYASGNTVTYQGITYSSLQNGNLNNTPNTSPTWWSSTTTFATPLATIVSNTLVAAPVFTTSVAHGLAVGSQITIKGSTATPSFNGSWTVATVPSATTFTLTGVPSAVGGASGLGFYNINGVPDTLVVIAASDLSTINTGTASGWALFKFASNVTLTAASLYTVQVSGTTAGNITPFRAAANDWARALRTTTAQAPASGDTVIVCGAYSGIGSVTSNTVTVDSGVTNAASYTVEICDHGTLAYSTAASINPYLKVATTVGTTAGISGWCGGTFTMGTQASPIPSTSTASLEFASTAVAPNNFGFDARSGFTISTGGTPLTYNSALLAADAAAGTGTVGTPLTTNVTTGWKAGDTVVIASTTQTKTQSEKIAVASSAGASLTLSANLANAHGGTGLTIAEVINLTRNVSMFSTSATNTGYVNIQAGAIANLQSTEFYNLGSATASKRGIDVGVTVAAGGSCTINNCSMHDFGPASATGIFCNAATNTNVAISNCVIYNTNGSCLATTSLTSATSNNSYSNIIGITSAGVCFSLADLMSNISNITAVGGTTGGISLADSMAAGQVMGTVSGLVAHSNTTIGINVTGITSYTNNPYGTISNITSWRNTTVGLNLTNAFGAIIDGAGSNGGQLFGNGTVNITFASSCGNIYLRNMVLNAGTTLVCPVGLSISNDMKDAYIDNSTFGATTTFATGDISIPAANIFSRFFARNCTFNSATTLANQLTNMVEGSEFSSARHQQTPGNHRSYKKFGTLSPDAVIYHYQSPSTRMTPNSVNGKLISGYKKIAVPNGQTATVNVWVRKSVAGDGTAYTGNQPRLIQRADAATGNNTDVVLATATNAANGAWQLLTATIAPVNDNCAVTLYIDCDGAAGWVNVDDWFVS
jgi:hypothetical protein